MLPRKASAPAAVATKTTTNGNGGGSSDVIKGRTRTASFGAAAPSRGENDLCRKTLSKQMQSRWSRDEGREASP